MSACSGAAGGNEYYEAYLAAQVEIENLGAQLDSTLIRIRDLEGAVTGAEAELAAAEASATDAQFNATRDAPAAEYHAQEARTRISQARSLLQSVSP